MIIKISSFIYGNNINWKCLKQHTPEKRDEVGYEMEDDVYRK